MRVEEAGITEVTVKKRQFGQSGIQVSEVGLGTWQIGSDWGNVPKFQAKEILRGAVENGVNFLDTADVYGAGRSESIIGEFLDECSEELFVATKIGRFPDPGWPDNFSLGVFRKHTEESLKRLGVEALDLTQLHCIPTEILIRGEVFDWLKILQKEGKIKRFGVSVETMDEALFCMQKERVTSLQIIFNIFRQEPKEKLFKTAKEKGVALIVRLPLASGLLTGKYAIDTEFSENDHRRYNREGEYFNVGETFAGIPFEKGIELVKKLRLLVPDGMTMAEMAIRWILDFDAVSVVIPGATDAGHVFGNVKASGMEPLDDELHQKLNEFYESEVEQHIRGAY